jgi:hypothetical protein
MSKTSFNWHSLAMALVSYGATGLGVIVLKRLTNFFN